MHPCNEFQKAAYDKAGISTDWQYNLVSFGSRVSYLTIRIFRATETAIPIDVYLPLSK